MISDRKNAEKYFANRRKKVAKEIGEGIALFIAAPKKIASRDAAFPYFQDTDFYYLTSHTEPDAALLITREKSILFLKERNKEHERWEGKILGTKRARSAYKIDEIRDYKNFFADFKKLVSAHSELHYTSAVDPKIDALIYELFSSSHAPNKNSPQKISDARLITSKMRLAKDAYEIKTLKKACEITALGFIELLKTLNSKTTESHAARSLEAEFAKLGAQKTSFETIVASGKNATILHHHASAKKISKKDLLLIDAGAQFDGYAGDISRTVPASGKFSQAQAEVYNVVLKTLESTVKKVKAGMSLEKLHQHAAKEITKGLISLKILKGSLQSNLKKENYKKYFMHGIGHLLGLDVHDIVPIARDRSGKIIDFKKQPLPTNSCITIEPGIYIDANDSSVPKKYRGIGIRIEEDVMVKKNGCEVMTKKLPRSIKEIEDLIGKSNTRRNS